MAPTISQIQASSYNAVLAKNRKAENQWAENALLREAEKQGMIEREDFGPQLEAPLDYQINQGATFLSTSLQPMAATETEVITDALYTPAELSVPVYWTKRTEGTNPAVNQKVRISTQLMENGITSHDQKVEVALFATSTNGFLGFLTHIPDNGQSSDGGIDSTTETYWRSQNATYVDDTDIEAGMTTVWNACAKGSGSPLVPTMIVSDGPTQAIFEGTQQANQRYVDEQELKAGFKVLAFKTARYVFSQWGGSRLYFLNPKSFKIYFSRDFYRAKGDTQEVDNANGFRYFIYSMCQTVTNNRSRLGVLHT